MNYLGIDAGGTHTRFVLFNHKGHEIERLETESIHFMKVGFNGITSGMKKAREYFEAKGHDFKKIKIAIGMGGFGEAKDVQEKIRAAIDPVFSHYLIMNDAKFAMVSALNNQDGVYLIAGTGSIAFKLENNQEERLGGFGYLLGDEGSAFWIGRKLLALFTQEADGRKDKSDLYSTIMNHFALKSPYDLITITNESKDYRGLVASLSSICAHIEDSSVQEIYYKAGLECARLANGFNPKKGTLLAYGGGVLKHNQFARDTFTENINKNYQLVENKNTVEYAAYLLFNS